MEIGIEIDGTFNPARAGGFRRGPAPTRRDTAQTAAP